MIDHTICSSFAFTCKCPKNWELHYQTQLAQSGEDAGALQPTGFVCPDCGTEFDSRDEMAKGKRAPFGRLIHAKVNNGPWVDSLQTDAA